MEQVFNNLMFTINAIFPLLILILLGYFLKKIRFFDDSFLDKANKFCFRVLIPVLLFNNMFKIEDVSKIDWGFIGFSSVAILAIFIIGIGIVKVCIPDTKQKGVVLQALFRSNYAIIGIPLATFLAPPEIQVECVAIATLVAAFSIPLFNMLAVISLSIFHHEEGQKLDVKKMIKNIFTNPLILGVASGLVALGMKFGISEIALQFGQTLDISNKALAGNFLFKAINDIASLASPLALIVLGGKFTFQAVGSLKKQICLGVCLRTIILPAIMLLLGYFLGYRTLYFPTLIALFATPVAVSSVPMTAEMGQDDTLAGQLVVWTSIVSVFSLFAMIMISCQLGILIA